MWGSSHDSRPSAWQAARVSALDKSSSGRRNWIPAITRLAGMPAMPRGPAPRASASSTVSAWSSRVWPRRTAVAPPSWPPRSAPRNGQSGRGFRAAGSTRYHDRLGSDRRESALPGPGHDPAACSADPACKTMINSNQAAPETKPRLPRTASPPRASESAPPEQATITSPADPADPAAAPPAPPASPESASNETRPC